MPNKMKLIVVANRTMWLVTKNKTTKKLERRKPSAGGLVTATSRIEKERVIGWPGENYNNANDSDELRQAVNDILDQEQTTPIHLSNAEYQAHYLNFANQVLWPLFHADSPALAAIFKDKAGWKPGEEAAIADFAQRFYKVNPKEERRDFTVYWQQRDQVLKDSSVSRNIMQYFSETIIEELHKNKDAHNKKSNDQILNKVVWIHDYQLILLPDLLRREVRRDATLQKQYIPIGFFCHIPFPHPDRWQAALKQGLSVYDLKEILLGPLGADLVGFQTQQYCNNFLDALNAFKEYLPGSLIVNSTTGKVKYEGRTIQVKAYPIGIDYAVYTSPAEAQRRKLPVETETLDEKTQEQHKEHMEKFINFHQDTTVILSVERLDPIKGIVEKLKAFEKLLELHKELIDKVSYECIVVPSRSGARINDELDVEIKEIANRINEKFKTKKFPTGPVHLVTEARDTLVLCEYYRRSHVINTASSADGMNLTAMEYVAARTEGTGGKVILSPLMGVTGHFNDHGGKNCYLNADPNNTSAEAIDEYANVLHTAVTTCNTPQAEQDMQTLKTIVVDHSNVHHWAQNYLKNTEKMAEENAQVQEIANMYPAAISQSQNGHRVVISSSSYLLPPMYSSYASPYSPYLFPIHGTFSMPYSSYSTPQSYSPYPPSSPHSSSSYSPYSTLTQSSPITGAIKLSTDPYSVFTGGYVFSDSYENSRNNNNNNNNNTEHNSYTRYSNLGNTPTTHYHNSGVNNVALATAYGRDYRNKRLSLAPLSIPATTSASMAPVSLSPRGQVVTSVPIPQNQQLASTHASTTTTATITTTNTNSRKFSSSRTTN